MIALNLPRVPLPDTIASRIGAQFPPHVLLAEKQATQAAYSFGLARGPRYEESRQWLLADIARANKVLAAFNPGLIVRGAA